MSSGGSFTITSSNDGTAVPTDGFRPGGNFLLSITGGTTIAATLQKRNPASNFVDIPNDDSLSTIGGAWEHEVLAAHDDVFKINVTSATGTWQVSFKPVR